MFCMEFVHCTASYMAKAKGYIAMVFLQGAEVLAFVILMEQTLNL